MIGQNLQPRFGADVEFLTSGEEPIRPDWTEPETDFYGGRSMVSKVPRPEGNMQRLEKIHVCREWLKMSLT